MPIYRTYKQGNLTVGVWKVDETVEQLRSMFHQFSIYEEAFARYILECEVKWSLESITTNKASGGEWNSR